MGCCSSKKPILVREPEVAQPPVIQHTVASPETRDVQGPIMFKSPEYDDRQFLKFICEVQLPAERNACNITDSVELPDGQLVFCDQRNGKLLLYDENFIFKSDLALGGLPSKITDIPWRKNVLAVTILNGDKIQYVKVDSGTLHVQEIALQTLNKCRGIDSTLRMLIYVMDDVITMQDQDNNVLKMGHNFDRPVSMLVDRKSEAVFILSEDNANSARLIKAKLDGNIREFDRRYQDIKSPVSLCTDQHGCLYICGNDPPSIYKVSPTGEILGAVYKARFGLLQHLQYCKVNDVFVLTKPNTNKLWIYRFE